MESIQENERKQAAKEVTINRPVEKTDPKPYSNVRLKLQPDRKALGNHKPRSQMTIFEFKMELEDVGSDGEK